MDTPTDNNKNRQALLDAARTLFWKHGIRRVTIQEICSEADVSKMTFYRQFANKNEIAAQVLRDILEKGMEDYHRIMQQEITFTEKMQQVIMLKHDATNNISDEFIKDIYQQNQTELRAMIETYQHEISAEVRNDFAQAQQNGFIRQDVTIDFIMYLMDRLTQMILDEKLLAICNDSQQAIMEVTRFFFYGILKQPSA
ncbi:MAG: TetR/AcrR family transcriptional regulator [Clostridia bacterium]|nr:TetR/AcrR family transcriptional regulator [Clostridia bacterium]